MVTEFGSTIIGIFGEGSYDDIHFGVFTALVSRWLFVLAAAGSAVGLGIIWKFPYIAGENGGGAFVLIYLVCIAAVGIPIMVSEVLLGRQGRSSPIHTMRKLASVSGRSQRWSVLGWMGVLVGFLILSYYAVIAGWAVNYIWLSGSGAFEGASAQMVGQSFDDFEQSASTHCISDRLYGAHDMDRWSRGDQGFRGCNPLVYAPVVFALDRPFGLQLQFGGFDQGFFKSIWAAITADSWLIAMGQAFFTLSLGMGTMMAYGAYVPDDANLGTTVVTIAALDTLIAVAAGSDLSHRLCERVGSGSRTRSHIRRSYRCLRPDALGKRLWRTFFLLLSFAAITSAISPTEPALSFLVEEYNAKRQRVAISLGVICWALGLGTVFSFNGGAMLPLLAA